MFNRLCQQIRQFRGRYRKFTLFKGRKRQKSNFLEILTLSEAADYLGIDMGTLVEEVASGHLPGEKLAGKWLFSRTALREHFSRYQRAGTNLDNWLSVDKEFENSNEQTAQNLIERYQSGERNFAGFSI